MFYVLWRTWSHWRALKSSQYLKALISHSQLSAESSKALDDLYSQVEESEQEKITAPPDAAKGPKILLTSEMVERLSREFGLDDQAGVSRADLAYFWGLIACHT